MNPVRMLLCSQDEEYLRSFAFFVRTNEEICGRYRLILFSDIDSLRKFTGSPEPYDVALCERPYLDVLGRSKHAEQVLLITDKPQEKNEFSGPSIYAYKSIPEILDEVRTAAAAYKNGWSDRDGIEGTEDTGGAEGGKDNTGIRIYTVGSASGGAGCTTVAAHLARHLGKYSRVCYISLETLPVLRQQEWTGDPLSEWLYYWRDGREEADQVIQQALWYNEPLRCHIVLPFKHPDDREQLTNAELDALILTLAGLRKFDFIVIDLPSGATRQVKTACRHAHRVVWLLTPDPFGMLKTEACLQELGLTDSDKSLLIGGHWVWVYNKSTGKHHPEPARFKETMARKPLALPYIPDWKQAASQSDIWHESLFERSIAALASKLSESDGGQEKGGESM